MNPEDVLYFPEDHVLVDFAEAPSHFVVGVVPTWRRVGPGMLVFDGFTPIEATPLYGGELMIYEGATYAVQIGEWAAQWTLVYN